MSHYDFNFYGDPDDDSHSRVASEAEADREYARNVGAMRPDCAWICSDRDVWHKNPFYVGPPQPHPEDDYADANEPARVGSIPAVAYDPNADECPF